MKSAREIRPTNPPMKATNTRLMICTLAGGLIALSIAEPAYSREKIKSSETIWYERIEAGCKADAKRYYSAIHFQKRRSFVSYCIKRAYR